MLTTSASPRRLGALLLVVLSFTFVAGTLSACGTKTVTDTGANGVVTTRTVPNVHFPKTKFLLHAGLAYGAFHRYIYKPYKANGFSKGSPKRVRTIAKAAASAAFVYHELKQADDAAQSSDILRRRVHDPLSRVLANLKDLPSLIKGGSFAAIANTSSLLDGVKSAASGAGANIVDK